MIMGAIQSSTDLLHVQAPEAIGQRGEEGLLTNNAVIQRPTAQNDLAGTVLGINGNGINSTSILPGQDGGKVEGITYVTPTFYGLTFGGSFIPNDRKNVLGVVDTCVAIKDIFSIGSNYTNTLGDVGFKTSFGWARGTIGSQWGGNGILLGGMPDSISDQDINFFNTGLNLSYAGFSLGGSLRWNVHNLKDGGIGSAVTMAHFGAPGFSLNGRAWDAGLMYATGPWAASVSYFGSNMAGLSRSDYGRKEEVTFLQASSRYALGPSVDLQALLGHGDHKGSIPGLGISRGRSYPDFDKNKGWAALTGLAMLF